MQIEDKRMIVNFITQALLEKTLTIYGDGSQTRSLCYVDDMVSGLCTLMFTEGLDNEIVNIGSEDEHSVKELAEIIKRLTNSSSPIEISEKLPQDDPLQRKPDLTKAKKLLHWSPEINLEEGFKKTIEYFKSQKT
jgi:UDP-glucuronate decarboxylase